MTRSTSLLITLLLATILPQVTLGRLAPVSEFCSLKICPTPKKDLVGLVNSHLDHTFGTDPAQCGDGICDISQGEDCSTCSKDCGSCELLEPKTKCVNPNHMALTFDDGPSEHTLKLLKHLRDANVKATFFVNAVYLLGKEDTLKRVFNDGHTIGSHTYSHRSLDNGHTAGEESNRNFDSLELSHMQSELYLNDAVIHSAIGKLPRFVRPPFLETSAESMAFMETAGYVPVNINVDSQDWQLDTTDAIVKTTIKALEVAKGDGSWIHLQHELKDYSVAAVPDIIHRLKSKGIKLVTLDECLGLPAYRDETDSPFLSKEIQSKVSKNDVIVATYAKASSTLCPTLSHTPAPVTDNSKSEIAPEPVFSDTPMKNDPTPSSSANSEVTNTGSVTHDNVVTPPEVTTVPILHTIDSNIPTNDESIHIEFPNPNSQTTRDSAEASQMISSSSVIFSQHVLLTVFFALCSIIIA